MEYKGIRNDVIYELKNPVQEAGYVYVRAWNINEVGFSVLDEPEKNPSFRNCGVFWVNPEDFKKIFKVSAYPRA